MPLPALGRILVILVVVYVILWFEPWAAVVCPDLATAIGGILLVVALLPRPQSLTDAYYLVVTADSFIDLS